MFHRVEQNCNSKVLPLKACSYLTDLFAYNCMPRHLNKDPYVAVYCHGIFYQCKEMFLLLRFTAFFWLFSVFNCILYLNSLQVVHPFDAQAEGELSLSFDDFVVVRQVITPLMMPLMTYRLNAIIGHP